MENLKKSVHYINQVSKCKTVLKPFLLEFFKQYEGKKIINANGYLTTKITINYPNFQPQPYEGEKAEIQYLITRQSGNVLVCDISLVFWIVDKSAHFERGTLYLYKVHDGILESPLDDEIEYIDAEEEIKKVRQYKQLSEEAYNIKTKIKVPEEVYRYAKL